LDIKEMEVGHTPSSKAKKTKKRLITAPVWVRFLKNFRGTIA
jgi:hypothetical protein